MNYVLVYIFKKVVFVAKDMCIKLIIKRLCKVFRVKSFIKNVQVFLFSTSTTTPSVFIRKKMVHRRLSEKLIKHVHQSLGLTMSVYSTKAYHYNKLI